MLYDEGKEENNIDIIKEFKNKYDIKEIESKKLNTDFIVTLLKVFNKSVGNSKYLNKKVNIINRILLNAMISGITKESDFDKILINLTGDIKASMYEYLDYLIFINDLEYNKYINYLRNIKHKQIINEEYMKYINRLNYINQVEYDNYIKNCFNKIKA